MSVDIECFVDNLIDIIKEEQIKLGYRSETVHIYYMLDSLNNILGTSYSIDEMQNLLNDLKTNGCRLGCIESSHKGERFRISVSPEGVEYVHNNIDPSEFIVAFVKLISRHGITVDDVKKLFYDYSEKVHFEKVSSMDFDYLVYFEDGCPDDYRYCLTDEGIHLIYHRYTPADYRDLFSD